MKRVALLLLAAALILLAGCTPGFSAEATQERTPVRLAMGYRPDIQFVPLYVAEELGYFDEAGFDVTFEHMPETEAAQLVGAGELPFAIVSGEQVLLAREQGIPIVYVMTWWQEYPVGIAYASESGIRTPADLVGKRVGIPGLYGASYIGFEAIMQSAGIDSALVELESIGYNQVEALYQGQEDAVVIYVNNEPVQLDALGLVVDVMRVSDYVHLMGNGLIASEETIASSPMLIAGFVEAFSRGIQAVLDDPDQAYEIAQSYVEGLAEADEAVQRSILEESLTYWQTDSIGYSDPQAWINMQNVLLDIGYLQGAQDVSQAFTNLFTAP